MLNTSKSQIPTCEKQDKAAAARDVSHHAAVVISNQVVGALVVLMGVNRDAPFI